MVENLARTGNAGNPNPREFESADLLEPTLQKETGWYEIAEEQADNTKTFGAGYGVAHADVNTDGWSDLDLQNANGNAISGSLRFRVYRDSDKEELVAQSGTYSLNSLRSAVSESRTDKALIPAMLSRVPRTDGYLTVEVSPNAGSVGDAVSAGNSTTDQGIAYSRLSFS